VKKTIREVEVSGKRVLVRADFNVPLEKGEVADDTRIRATLPTIRTLLEQEARVVLCSHLGRPKGRVVEELRLDPVARRLSELLGRGVDKLDDCVGPDVESAVAGMGPGDVALLENTRFHPGEKENDGGFAAQLAGLADLYVNDAFAAAHRAHASTEGVAHHLPAVAGLLMERELEALGRVRQNPEHPFVAILGGAKIADKIGVARWFLAQAEQLLVGGGMANTFLKAKGFEVGDSLVEEESVGTARDILQEAGEKMTLPVDAVIAREISASTERHVVPVDRVTAGWKILDVGPETIDLFEEKIQPASLVVWNGPLGVFEVEPFAAGTFALARAMAELDAVTVVGGGESGAAVHEVGVAERMTHVSTGGGAFLQFMEGEPLPGVAALEDA